jgi:hypothetical protein
MLILGGIAIIAGILSPSNKHTKPLISCSKGIISILAIVFIIIQTWIIKNEKKQDK